MRAARLSTYVFLLLILPAVSARASVRQNADDIKPIALLSLLEKANLDVSARIYYGGEDEEEIPVITEFYLLDKSVVEILKNAKFTPESESKFIDEEIYLEALAKLLTEQKDEEDDLLNYLFWEAARRSTVSKLETDYFGFGRSEEIKAGNYYLFACQQIEGEIFIWNYPVYLSGTKEIEIDQNNASIVLSD